MTKEILIKSALRELVNEQVKQGSGGYALEEDSAYEVSWENVLEWLEQQPSKCTEHPCLGKLCRYYKQPSEDCISRAYIEPIIEELENICINGDEHILSLLSNIKNAPPVTPSYNSIKTELDCVSRQAVRRILVEATELGSWDDSSMINRQDAIECVEMLPSAQAEGKWISASEKVPDYGQEVLLFDKNFGYVVGTYEMVNYFGVAEPSFLIHKSIDSLEKASIDPIAWMPLPKTYKEDEQNES